MKRNGIEQFEAAEWDVEGVEVLNSREIDVAVTTWLARRGLRYDNPAVQDLVERGHALQRAKRGKNSAKGGPR